eukprot:12692675-Alexandrium_andersonii.AAC.1
MVLEELWVNLGARKREKALGPALRILQSMQDGDEEDPAVANLLMQHGQFIDCGRSDATINGRSG